jgi:ribose transport system permease protein
MSQLLTDLKYRIPGRYLASWGALASLLVVVIVTVPVTLHASSLQTLTALAGVLALAAFGQMLVVMLGAIDLSVPAIITVSAGMVVHYGTAGANVLLVVLGALAVAVAISLVNWFFIGVLRINPIIVTLGTLGIVEGGVRVWTGVSFSLSGLSPRSIKDFGQSSWLNLNACLYVAIAAGVVLAVVLSKTRGGRQVAAIGANRRAARFQGVPIARVECAAFAGAGLLYGIAGILVAGVIGTPDVVIGDPYQLLTITAVAVAGAAFNGGPGSVAGVISASLFLELLDQAMQIHGFSAGVRTVAQGGALVLAVSALTLAQLTTSRVRSGLGRRKRAVQVQLESSAPASHIKEAG